MEHVMLLLFTFFLYFFKMQKFAFSVMISLLHLPQLITDIIKDLPLSTISMLNISLSQFPQVKGLLMKLFIGVFINFLS
jgi:hypothetical protein